MRAFATAVVLLLSGCVPPRPAVAPYYVVNIVGDGDSARLVACAPTTDWTEDYLVQTCGEAERVIYAWRGEPHIRCFIYLTRDATYPAAARIAVCTAPAGAASDRRPKLSSGLLGEGGPSDKNAAGATGRKVLSIVGLRE